MRAHRRWHAIAGEDGPEPYVRRVILRQYLSWRRRRASTERPIAEPPDGPAGVTSPTGSPTPTRCGPRCARCPARSAPSSSCATTRTSRRRDRQAARLRPGDRPRPRVPRTAPAPVRADPRAGLLPALSWRQVMSDVETCRVRDLLQRHAADAPAGATLLTAVAHREPPPHAAHPCPARRGRHRARRRRRDPAAAARPAPITVAAPSTLSEPATPATVTFPFSPPADPAGPPPGPPPRCGWPPGCRRSACRCRAPAAHRHPDREPDPPGGARRPRPAPPPSRSAANPATPSNGDDAGEPGALARVAGERRAVVRAAAFPRVPVDRLAGFAEEPRAGAGDRPGAVHVRPRPRRLHRSTTSAPPRSPSAPRTSPSTSPSSARSP